MVDDTREGSAGTASPMAQMKPELGTIRAEDFQEIQQPFDWKYHVIGTCDLCGEPRLRGQVWSGVRTKDAPALQPDGTRPNDIGYYEGHHGCVVSVIGGEEAMRLMFAGQLGMVDPSSLVDGMLKE